MKIVKPTFYKNFKCIAGACPDSCCQGWEVDVDAGSLSYYSTLTNELEIKRRIDSVLGKDEFDNTIFTLAPKKRCPFLNDKNLCDMHIAIGGEHTPETCRNFPRFFYDYGATREIGVSFSCPVAADMIYDLKTHMSFEEELNSDPPTLNDIDALTYFKLVKERKNVLSILQSDDMSMKEKLCSILTSAKDYQKELDDYSEGADDISFFEVFDNPELINPEWEEKVKKGIERSIENTLFNENIAVYFVYKYFLSAVYDLDVLSKVKMAAVGVLINTYFGDDAWTMHLWSKETEHSQYNMDRYKKLLREASCLNADELIKRIKK